MKNQWSGKLFLGLAYEYWKDLGFGQSEYRKPPMVIMHGSFWVIQNGSESLIVTAAHTLGTNWETPKKVDDNNIDGVHVILHKVSGSVLLGTLAYEPSKIGILKDNIDVAFLKPEDSRMLASYRPLELADSAPKNGEHVSVFGYPGTLHPQEIDAVITAVHEDGGFFVLNTGVGDGCSGGVVTNKAGKAYGVISNTDLARKQTTVLRILPRTLGSIEWKEPKAVLNRSFR